MKYKVIGLKTNKVYYESESKVAALRKLTEIYPYRYGCRGAVSKLYDEPLMILGGKNTKETMNQAIYELISTGKFLEK